MEHAGEIVVLLHGIARTRLSMRPMEQELKRAGYRTLNLSYPSRRLDLAAIAAWLDRRFIAAGLWEAHRVHFVTHSMGGLVAARYFADFAAGSRAPRLGRVVMLAPPNQGSEVADFLEGLPPYRWLYGPAGQQLTTSARSNAEAGLPCDVGIIAGTAGRAYLLGRLLIRAPHDGRVAVARTQLPGMRDHLVVHATHSFIMRKPEVQRQVLHFLEHGSFERA